MTPEYLAERRAAMQQELRQRWPLPASSVALVDVWHGVAREIAAAHPDAQNHQGMRGDGEPIGPLHSEFGARHYRLFLVYFLPYGERPRSNHNLSVEFRVDGSVKIAAMGRGVKIEIIRQDTGPDSFLADLRGAADYVGLL